MRLFRNNRNQAIRIPVEFELPGDRAVIRKAIDIAKHRPEILIEIPGRARRRRLTILNTRADHDRLVDALAGFEQPIVAGFEATGNHHRPLVYRLLTAGIDPLLISSLTLARTRDPRDRREPAAGFAGLMPSEDAVLQLGDLVIKARQLMRYRLKCRYRRGRKLLVVLPDRNQRLPHAGRTRAATLPYSLR